MEGVRGKEREELDASLVADVKHLDPFQRRLRQTLGV